MNRPRILGLKPNLKDINLLCRLFLASVASMIFVTHMRPEQVRVTDFAQIYSVGRLLNEYPAQDLYNFPLQQKLFNQVHRLTEAEGYYGPSPYPPFVAILFRPFARAPYYWAYVLWMLLSVSLYLAGLAIITRRFFPEDPLRRSLIVCLALAFNPFIMGTVINGQLSSIAFFSIAFAIREDDSGQPLLSGLALSLCAYKPTLLVLILPMLFITRRFKTLAGFSVGALGLVLFPTAIEGVGVWSGYPDMLRLINGIHSSLRLPVYIDLRSFTTLLSPAHRWIIVLPVLGFAAWAGCWLFRIWMSAVRAQKTASALVWASTLTWTLVLNIYVPVYDSILIVISMVATAGVLKNFAGRWFGILCALIFGSVWVNVEIAKGTGIQILTILLAALGILQLHACRREIAMSIEGRSSESSEGKQEQVPSPSLRKGASTIVINESLP